jgi:hypothetical protein
LQYREDKRGNKYRLDYKAYIIYGMSSNGIFLFSWGNNLAFSNTCFNSFIDTGNAFMAGCYFYSNAFAAGCYFYSNAFMAGCLFYSNTFAADCEFSSNTLAAGCYFFSNAFMAGCYFYSNAFAAGCYFYSNAFMAGCEFYSNAFAAGCEFSSNTLAASCSFYSNVIDAFFVRLNAFITITGITYSANYDNNTLLPGIVNIPSGSTYDIDGSPHTHAGSGVEVADLSSTAETLGGAHDDGTAATASRSDHKPKT